MSEVREWKAEVELVSITPQPEKVIEQAYRNCWQSAPKTASVESRRRFIKRCIRRGHLSPLEFAFATFRITASRACTHQLVRHRIASYAQESQRYVRAVEGYVAVPPRIYDNPRALEIFEETIAKIWDSYDLLLELGVKKEDARYLLPNACKSKIIVGMNFRSWRHFIKLRCHQTAQWEIRGVATEVLKILYDQAPGVFGDLYQKFILNEGRGELWTERD